MKLINTLTSLGSIKASLLITSLVIPQLLFQSPAKADQWNKNPLEVACKSYETNKFDKKEQVVGGGWTPGWADDIAEKDVGLGLVSAGVSVFDGGSSFTIWVTNLVERTISSLGQSLEGNAKKEAIRVAKQVIYDAVSGKSGKEITKQFDTFDFKAGAIRYSGTNREPIFCNTISKTWGLKPYVAFRIRSSSNPSSAENPAITSSLAHTFGYIKNSRLVATGKSPEPMSGHVNWAMNTGQSLSTVENEIRSDLAQARASIARSPSSRSCEAFGHMKNGMLSLLRGTTEPHQGHVNWCRDRLNNGQWNQVVSSMDREFVKPIQTALR